MMCAGLVQESLCVRQNLIGTILAGTSVGSEAVCMYAAARGNNIGALISEVSNAETGFMH